MELALFTNSAAFEDEHGKDEESIAVDRMSDPHPIHMVKIFTSMVLF